MYVALVPTGPRLPARSVTRLCISYEPSLGRVATAKLVVVVQGFQPKVGTTPKVPLPLSFSSWHSSVGLTSAPLPSVHDTEALELGLVGVLNVGASGAVRSSS